MPVCFNSDLRAESGVQLPEPIQFFASAEAAQVSVVLVVFVMVTTSSHYCPRLGLNQNPAQNQVTDRTGPCCIVVARGMVSPHMTWCPDGSTLWGWENAFSHPLESLLQSILVIWELPLHI